MPSKRRDDPDEIEAERPAQPLLDEPKPEPQSTVAVAVHRDRLGEVLKDVPDPDRAPEFTDPHAQLTKALGARYWTSDKVFDWARRATGERLRFTRYYFRQFGLERHVIVDIFAAENQATAKEIALKQEAIRKENEQRAASQRHPTIGYLPTIRGAFISEDAIAAVKRGEVLDLIDLKKHDGLIA